MSPDRNRPGAHPPGRLAAVMLRALVAELADPGRYARARAYARDGAVVDLDVQPGVVVASVQGSRAEAYRAMVHVTPLDDGGDGSGTAIATALQIPGRDEIATSCTCPDGDDYGAAICKHALATLMVLADQVAVEPDALARWRSGRSVSWQPAARAVDPREAPRPTAVDVLADRLRSPLPRPTLAPIDPLPMRPAKADDVTDALVSALAALTGAS